MPWIWWKCGKNRGVVNTNLTIFCAVTRTVVLYVGGVDISEPSKEGVARARKWYKQAIVRIWFHSVRIWFHRVSSKIAKSYKLCEVVSCPLGQVWGPFGLIWFHRVSSRIWTLCSMHLLSDFLVRCERIQVKVEIRKIDVLNLVKVQQKRRSRVLARSTGQVSPD